MNTDIINTIINKKRKYGKSNIGNNKKININLNINNPDDLLSIKYIRSIIYIDNISRILSFIGYTPNKECYINNNELDNINTITKKIDNYRIDINEFINKDIIYQEGLIDNIITKLRYTDLCYIKDDNLYIETTKYQDTEDRLLIDKNGFYNDLLFNIANHINKLNKDYIGIIDISNKPLNGLKQSLQILSYNNILTTKIIEDNLLDNLNNLDINNLRYLISSINIEEPIEDYTNNKFNYIEEQYVTICSILNKNKIISIDNYTTIQNNKAYNILNKLNEFENIVISSANNLEPNMIANYTYELSKLFNSYYEEEKNNDYKSIYTKERLNLLLATKIVLSNALDLIGIIPREQM